LTLRSAAGGHHKYFIFRRNVPAREVGRVRLEGASVESDKNVRPDQKRNCRIVIDAA
jgi:hypothetical protein